MSIVSDILPLNVWSKQNTSRSGQRGRIGELESVIEERWRSKTERGGEQRQECWSLKWGDEKCCFFLCVRLCRGLADSLGVSLKGFLSSAFQTHTVTPAHTHTQIVTLPKSTLFQVKLCKWEFLTVEGGKMFTVQHKETRRGRNVLKRRSALVWIH